MRRRKKVKYIVHVSLLRPNHAAEKFSAKIDLAIEPLHGDLVHLTVSGMQYSYIVDRRDIGIRQSVWIICRPRQASREELNCFRTDSHWHKDAATEQIP